MNFKTSIEITPYPFHISYHDNLLFLGSCFAENISAYFEELKFGVAKNPFGILYHPKAILKSIQISLEQNDNMLRDSFEYNGVWSNFHTHSDLSAISKREHIAMLEQAQSDLRHALKSSDIVFISLGTAWVYKHLGSQQTVANCHKLPQKEFQKELLDPETTATVLGHIVGEISKINPTVKLIFTLSPVRHLKDGFVENQMSKSVLHLSIQDVVKANTNVFYFPSYEILLDDLRDYRYYTSDFVHPNSLALDYIWEKLKSAFFDAKTLHTLKTVLAINKRLAHRFFNPEHPDNILFQQKTKEMISDVQKKHPHIKF